MKKEIVNSEKSDKDVNTDLTEALVNEALDYVVGRAVKKWEMSSKKAKICGCRNCKLEHQDDEDRLDWITNLGRWKRGQKSKQV